MPHQAVIAVVLKLFFYINNFYLVVKPMQTFSTTYHKELIEESGNKKVEVK